MPEFTPIKSGDRWPVTENMRVYVHAVFACSSGGDYRIGDWGRVTNFSTFSVQTDQTPFFSPRFTQLPARTTPPAKTLKQAHQTQAIPEYRAVPVHRASVSSGTVGVRLGIGVPALPSL